MISVLLWNWNKSSLRNSKINSKNWRASTDGLFVWAAAVFYSENEKKIFPLFVVEIVSNQLYYNISFELWLLQSC